MRRDTQCATAGAWLESRCVKVRGYPSVVKEALIKSPLRKSDPVSTIEIHLPLKSKSFLRHPSNLKFGQDFQLRLNQRFLNTFPLKVSGREAPLLLKKNAPSPTCMCGGGTGAPVLASSQPVGEALSTMKIVTLGAEPSWVAKV